MSKKVHCRSLSSIHILYNHDPVQALYSLPGRWTQFEMSKRTEVVLYKYNDVWVYLLSSSGQIILKKWLPNASMGQGESIQHKSLSLILPPQKAVSDCAPMCDASRVCPSLCCELCVHSTSVGYDHATSSGYVEVLGG